MAKHDMFISQNLKNKPMNRYDHNPVIKPSMVEPSNPGYRVRGAFNPGATLYKDEIILLLRVAEDCKAKDGHAAVPIVTIKNGKGIPDILEVQKNDPDVVLKDTRGIVYKGKDYLSTMSHIRVARSKDGKNFTIDKKPFIFPDNNSEIFGVEDARITKMKNEYFINYTCVSNDGWATCLAKTTDFKKIKKLGIIFPPQNKDVSIFPEKIGNKFYALHRPNNSGFGKPSIWISESPDLLHWGNHKCIARPRNTLWEEQKIGGGAPCIKTSKGWMQIYHGKGRNQIYSLFLLLLDLNNPCKVIARSEIPLLKPEESYETNGFFPNVVFTNGLVEKDDQVFVYYGACDETTCLAETSIKELLRAMQL
jgi:predicted GH43/DUF377 family glycosyl hydrolase